MTGRGPKHERETIINFNEESDTASIWTASEVVYRRLKKLGYMPAQDNERSAVFENAQARHKATQAQATNKRSTAGKDKGES